MTYLQLAKKIQDEFNQEQQNSDVTVHSGYDEYFPISLEFASEKDCDVLDDGHPILVICGE
jgi:hypothetical protein